MSAILSPRRSSERNPRIWTPSLNLLSRLLLGSPPAPNCPHPSRYRKFFLPRDSSSCLPNSPPSPSGEEPGKQRIILVEGDWDSSFLKLSITIVVSTGFLFERGITWPEPSVACYCSASLAPLTRQTSNQHSQESARSQPEYVTSSPTAGFPLCSWGHSERFPDIMFNIFNIFNISRD